MNECNSPDMTGNVMNGPYPGVKHQDGSTPPQKPDVSEKGKNLGLTMSYAPDTQVD